jgi:D-glycero-D-manno-heptose 1,7-bisphosphate phosphatase
MVGDSQSDLELAQEVAFETGGCASIRIGSGATHSVIADAAFGSLWDFAVAVERACE